MVNPNHTQNVAQIVYFSHGGGPLPILGDPSHEAMVDFMRQLPSRLKKPDAILVISAHWEESTATLLGAQTPSMLYDYYGFPDEAYEMTYPAPGNPNLAHRIAGLLLEVGGAGDDGVREGQGPAGDLVKGRGVVDVETGRVEAVHDGVVDLHRGSLTEQHAEV